MAFFSSTLAAAEAFCIKNGYPTANIYTDYVMGFDPIQFIVPTFG